MVLLKGEFDLISNQKEEDIRRELERIFKRKYPCINMYDFEFVKRDRHTISTPVVKEAHLWDFAHVKHLRGNGRLYVRLVTSRKDIEHTEHKDSTLTASSEDVVSPTNSASVTTLEADNDEEDLLEVRANLLTTDEKVSRIAVVFPGIPLNVIRGAVHAHGSIERAVNAHPRRPRGSQSGRENRRDESLQAPREYRVLPNHFQKFKRMPPPDWAQKNLY